MKKLYSSAQSRQIDETSQGEFCIPDITLMEDAAFSLYSEIRDDISRHTRQGNGRAVFLAGGGNNGGDALAVARLAFLDEQNGISIYLCDEGRESPLREIQRKACEKLGIPRTDVIMENDLIIDGLLGVGLKGNPKGRCLDLIEEINGKGCTAYAIDVPSGIGDDALFGHALNCERTYFMGVPKASLYCPGNRASAGRIGVLFPFFPRKAIPESEFTLLEPEDARLQMPKADSYKNTRKSLAVIGGSGQFTGAVALAARAAFHTGIGLVTIYTERGLVPIVSRAVPSAMVSPYEDCRDLSGFDAVLIGPGMGDGHDDMLAKALSEADRIVVDADGIRAFSRLKADGLGKCILTPHPGEYRTLMDAFAPGSSPDTPESWFGTLRTIQERTNATLAVKASTVWIKGKDRTVVVDGSNPSLGVAGSGDVLGGIIATLFAQGREDAAEQGALIHQNAGRTARRRYGYFGSDELIGFIGSSIQGH